jgi:hypothetical protein
MFEFLTKQLQSVNGAIKYYNDNYDAPSRAEYLHHYSHVKEYLEGQIENFKREHAL